MHGFNAHVFLISQWFKLVQFIPMVNFTLLEDIPTRRIITLFVGMSSKQVSWTIGKFKRIWTHCYVVDSKYQQDPWLGFPHCSTWSQQVSFPLTCWLRPVTSLPPILFGYLLGPLMSTYESHYTSHLTVANLVIMPLPIFSYPSSLCSSLCLALHPSHSLSCPSAHPHPPT